MAQQKGHVWSIWYSVTWTKQRGHQVFQELPPCWCWLVSGVCETCRATNNQENNQLEVNNNIYFQGKATYPIINLNVRIVKHMSMINNFLLLFIFREPLDPGLKLAITLRHMATGPTFRELMWSEGLGGPFCILSGRIFHGGDSFGDLLLFWRHYVASTLLFQGVSR